MSDVFVSNNVRVIVSGSLLVIEPHEPEKALTAVLLREHAAAIVQALIAAHRLAPAPPPTTALACTECPYIFSADEVTAENKNAWGHPCHGARDQPNAVCESFREPTTDQLIGSEGVAGYQDLLDAAEKATQGEWEYRQLENGWGFYVKGDDEPLFGEEPMWSQEPSEDDSTYIALANPTRIKQLITAFRTVINERDSLRKELDNVKIREIHAAQRCLAAESQRDGLQQERDALKTSLKDQCLLALGMMDEREGLRREMEELAGRYNYLLEVEEKCTLANSYGARMEIERNEALDQCTALHGELAQTRFNWQQESCELQKERDLLREQRDHIEQRLEQCKVKESK